MQRENTRILFEYWNELRGNRSAPERREIEPTKIRQALSSTFILEAQDDGEFNFRLAGSHLCSSYCRELKNRSFNNLWQQKDRDAIGTLIHAVTDDCAVALVTFEATTETNNHLTYETILLPLSNNGTTQSRILGSMQAFDEPYWLGAHPVLEQRISGLRLIWPNDLNSDEFKMPAPRSEFTFGQTGEGDLTGVPARIHGRQARRYSHLAVIDGGRN